MFPSSTFIRTSLLYLYCPCSAHLGFHSQKFLLIPSPCLFLQVTWETIEEFWAKKWYSLTHVSKESLWLFCWTDYRGECWGKQGGQLGNNCTITDKLYAWENWNTDGYINFSTHTAGKWWTWHSNTGILTLESVVSICHLRLFNIFQTVSLYFDSFPH